MANLKATHVSSAIERAGRRLVDAYTKETGLVHADKAQEALQDASPAEQRVAEALLAGAAKNADAAEGPTRNEVYAFLDASVAKLRSADVDKNWELDPSELAQLDEVGQLAAKMAAALEAQPVVPSAEAHAFAGLEGERLKSKLREVSGAHRELDYDYARVVLFSDIANAQGEVTGVYTGDTFTGSGAPRGRPAPKLPPGIAPGSKQAKQFLAAAPKSQAPSMTTEHVWPKARGVEALPALSDLHHLFPVDRETNGRRGNHPFGEVLVPHWSRGGSVLGAGKDGETVFQPRPGTRGAVARALMYVHTMYDLPFPPGEAEVVQRWNAEEPPTDDERRRNDEVSRIQGNRNPYVDLPELVARALVGHAESAPGANAPESGDLSQELRRALG